MIEYVRHNYNKIKNFVYAVGYFGEVIMFILAVVLLFKNYTDLIFYIIGLGFSDTLNKYLKKIIKQSRPENVIKYLDSEKIDKTKVVYGMPSGHSQNVFYSIFYLYMCCVRDQNLILLLFAFMGMITIYQRYTFYNHTILQLVVGAILGISIAYSVLYIKNIVLNVM